MQDMKTDLSKILSISGRHGLYRFVAQARNGVIAESLADGSRTAFGSSSRITALSDVAIYTSDGEVKLQEVFKKIKETLGDRPALTSKDPDDELKAFFAEALPDYDEDRFYVSHMKKVVEWYNDLAAHASLDFEEEKEDGEKGEETADGKTDAAE